MAISALAAGLISTVVSSLSKQDQNKEMRSTFDVFGNQPNIQQQQQQAGSQPTIDTGRLVNSAVATINDKDKNSSTISQFLTNYFK